MVGELDRSASLLNAYGLFVGPGTKPQRRKVQQWQHLGCGKHLPGKEFDGVLDGCITQGYEVVNQGENSALCGKSTWGTSGGHVLWALLTDWWTWATSYMLWSLMTRLSRVMLKPVEG